MVHVQVITAIEGFLFTVVDMRGPYVLCTLVIIRPHFHTPPLVSNIYPTPPSPMVTWTDPFFLSVNKAGMSTPQFCLRDTLT
jgi:hypothetical protein